LVANLRPVIGAAGALRTRLLLFFGDSQQLERIALQLGCAMRSRMLRQYALAGSLANGFTLISTELDEVVSIALEETPTQ